MENTPELLALRKAVETAGGQSALARKIGGRVKQAHIWGWLNKFGRTPAERVIDIVVATGGVVTAHDLRPDLFPPGFEFPPEMLPSEHGTQGTPAMAVGAT